MSVILDIFIKGNSADFESSMKQVRSAAQRTGDAIGNSIGAKIRGALSAAAVSAYAAKIINFADNITDLSEQLGKSTQELQEWGYAAEKNGSKLETVTKFFEQLAQAREKALSGDENALESFSRLGVSESALRKGGFEKLIAEKVRNSNVQDIIGPLRDVGGKSAGELIPAMKAGIDEMAQAAHDAGVVLNDELLERIKSLKTETENWADVFKGPMARAIGFLAQQLGNIHDFTKIFVGGFGTFIGTLLGGGSLADASSELESFANSVADDRIKKEQAIQQQAQLRASQTESTNGVAKLRTISFEPKKNEIENLALNSWQKLGAAIRFSADNKQIGILQRIERNTAVMASNVKPKAGSLETGNFGAFGP